MMLHKHTKFGNKMFCGSEDIIRTNIVNQFFCMTLHLIIIHQDTKFALKWFSGSGDIVWTKSDTWTA